MKDDVYEAIQDLWVFHTKKVRDAFASSIPHRNIVQTPVAEMAIALNLDLAHTSVLSSNVAISILDELIPYNPDDEPEMQTVGEPDATPGL